MFCGKCGKQAREGDKFCPECGAPFFEDEGTEEVIVSDAASGAERTEGDRAAWQTAQDGSGQAGYTPPQYIPAPVWQYNQPVVQQQPQKEKPEKEEYNGFALAGFICSIIAILWQLIFWVLLVNFSAPNILRAVICALWSGAGLALSCVGLVRLKIRSRGQVLGIIGACLSAFMLMIAIINMG